MNKKQETGIIRQVIEPEKNWLIKNPNSNEEIRKACEANNELKKPLRMYKDSLRVTEKNLSNLALNGNKFKITEAATEEDLNHFNKFWRCSWITRSSI